jgi:uncharacterized protein (DUF2147 family)
MCLLIACTAGILLGVDVHAKNPPILGRWVTDKNDLVVEVYQIGAEYRGRIVWVSDKSGTQGRLDEKNPNVALRNRRVVGMDVLDGLTSSNDANSWENGHIYDATSGKTWSATARLEDPETLVVRGYWGFQLFGKTLTFKRYKGDIAMLGNSAVR